jgi:hypothetical protein
LALQRPTPIVYGRWSVAINLVVDACKHGTLNRGFTLNVLPIRNEQDLSVAAIALSEMLRGLGSG